MLHRTPPPDRHKNESEAQAATRSRHPSPPTQQATPPSPPTTSSHQTQAAKPRLKWPRVQLESTTQHSTVPSDRLRVTLLRETLPLTLVELSRLHDPHLVDAA